MLPLYEPHPPTGRVLRSAQSPRGRCPSCPARRRARGDHRPGGRCTQPLSEVLAAVPTAACRLARCCSVGRSPLARRGCRTLTSPPNSVNGAVRARSSSRSPRSSVVIASPPARSRAITASLPRSAVARRVLGVGAVDVLYGEGGQRFARHDGPDKAGRGAVHRGNMARERRDGAPLGGAAPAQRRRVQGLDGGDDGGQDLGVARRQIRCLRSMAISCGDPTERHIGMGGNPCRSSRRLANAEIDIRRMIWFRDRPYSGPPSQLLARKMAAAVPKNGWPPRLSAPVFAYPASAGSTRPVVRVPDHPVERAGQGDRPGPAERVDGGRRRRVVPALDGGVVRAAAPGGVGATAPRQPRPAIPRVSAGSSSPTGLTRTPAARSRPETAPSSRSFSAVGRLQSTISLRVPVPGPPRRACRRGRHPLARDGRGWRRRRGRGVGTDPGSTCGTAHIGPRTRHRFRLHVPTDLSTAAAIARHLDPRRRLVSLLHAPSRLVRPRRLTPGRAIAMILVGGVARRGDRRGCRRCRSATHPTIPLPAACPRRSPPLIGREAGRRRAVG